MRPMILRCAVFAVVVAVAATTSWSRTGELGLNGDAARFGLGWEVFEDTGRVDFGWLHRDDSDGEVVHVGLHRTGFATGSIEAGVGGRAVWVDGGTRDGYAVALGGFASVPIPGVSRLSVDGHAYFAPDVVSGGELESYTEFGVGASYRLFGGARIFAGYRLVDVEFDLGPDVDLDDDLYLGVSIEF